MNFDVNRLAPIFNNRPALKVKRQSSAFSSGSTLHDVAFKVGFPQVVDRALHERLNQESRSEGAQADRPSTG
jgi:hypothetical protein